MSLQGGELNKAEQLLHVALKMAQETKNEQAVTYIFDLLANLAYQREEYPKAQRLFKDVLQRLLSGVQGGGRGFVSFPPGEGHTSLVLWY